jgi:hypothetical protein
MTPPETVDWVAWHRPYDDPASRLSRRLALVQQHLRAALDRITGPVTVISMCAGQGRDVVPVLAKHPRRAEVRALLVEIDERNVRVARESAHAAGLDSVTVTQADAALTDSYAAYVPGDVILACGIFGNISLTDIERTVRALPSLAAPGATVLWTRGRRPGDDPTPDIRRWFEESGFEEIAFDAPDEESFSVGVNRLRGKPAAFAPGLRLFEFFR